MSWMEEFQLKNIDPEDISDVIIKIQKSFGLTFHHTDFKEVKNFGEMCDVIVGKLEGENIQDCTSQQAFYRLRTAICHIHGINPAQLTPETSLVDLFPRKNRRLQIHELDNYLGFPTGILRPKYWVSSSLGLAMIGSIFTFFVSWKLAVGGLILSIVLNWIANKYFATELDPLSLGDLSEKITRENYKQLRLNAGTVNRQEVERVLVDFFSHELDLDRSLLNREATFN